MQNEFEDITNNLSSDPIEREQQLYNRILELFKNFKEKNRDTTIWEGKTYIKLMKLLKKGGEYNQQSIWNAILIILALFSAREEIIPPFGIDVKNLAPPEQKKIQMLLREVFVLEKNSESK